MFGTSGIRGRFGDEVTAGTALSVGRAVASEGARRVVVGRDPRATGGILADAVAAGLRECGADVTRLGLAATPTIARAVGWRDADAGVAVTASHNPPADNGLKLWQPSGQAYDGAQREAVAGRIREGTYDQRPWDGIGRQTRWDGARDRHLEALRGAITDGSNLSVVVDVGNGAGGLTADALAAMGCGVETLNAQPDGRFPGRPSEPTAEHCRSLCALVERTDADLGVAHDGDADRMQAVTGDGAFVPGDVTLALFAREAAGDGDRVAVPVDTSLAVDDALGAVGATTVRTKVGDVFVAEAAAGPDVAFGGEPSGAWIWPDESLCPDGPLAACRLVELVTRRGPLADLVAGIDPYPIRRGTVPVGDRAAVMERVAAAVSEDYESVSTLDGVRVDREDAWFLIRASGTQPLVRVTAEARDGDRAEAAFEEARGIVADAVDAEGP